MYRDEPDDYEEACPDYSVASAPSQNGSGPSISGHARSVSSPIHYLNPYHDNLSSPRTGPTEKIVYSYNVMAGSAELQFIIAIVPKTRSTTNYTFSLTMKAGRVERSICEPVDLRLAVNPRQLQFAVFIFSPKVSLPAGCRWALRVWLRVSGVDHRIFAEDDLWVGRDPDFRSIRDAIFTQLKSVTHDTQTYQGRIGRTVVNYNVRWERIRPGEWNLSLEYEVAGVGRVLFDNYPVTFDCDASAVMFLIYTIPMSSNPPGASHRIRLWLCSPCTASDSQSLYTSTSQQQSFIYQRIWKSDDLRIGTQLDFAGLGQMTMASPTGRGPETIAIEPLRRALSPTSASVSGQSHAQSWSIASRKR